MPRRADCPPATVSQAVAALKWQTAFCMPPTNPGAVGGTDTKRTGLMLGNSGKHCPGITSLHWPWTSLYLTNEHNPSLAEVSRVTGEELKSWTSMPWWVAAGQYSRICARWAVSRATPVLSPWATPGQATERSWGDCGRWVETVGGAEALDELTAWAGLHVRPGLASTLGENSTPCRVWPLCLASSMTSFICHASCLLYQSVHSASYLPSIPLLQPWRLSYYPSLPRASEERCSTMVIWNLEIRSGGTVGTSSVSQREAWPLRELALMVSPSLLVNRRFKMWEAQVGSDAWGSLTVGSWVWNSVKKGPQQFPYAAWAGLNAFPRALFCTVCLTFTVWLCSKIYSVYFHLARLSNVTGGR